MKTDLYKPWSTEAKKIKAPREPYKPYAPSKPCKSSKTYKKDIDIAKLKLVVTVQDILLAISKYNQEQNSSVDYSDIRLDVCQEEDDYYPSVYLFHTVNVPKDKETIDREENHYKELMAYYNEQYAKYKLKLEKYKKELIDYNQKMVEYREKVSQANLNAALKLVEESKEI